MKSWSWPELRYAPVGGLAAIGGALQLESADPEALDDFKAKGYQLVAQGSQKTDYPILV